MYIDSVSAEELVQKVSVSNNVALTLKPFLTGSRFALLDSFITALIKSEFQDVNRCGVCLEAIWPFNEYLVNASKLNLYFQSLVKGLMPKQEPLGAEFEKILIDNLSTLYED